MRQAVATRQKLSEKAMAKREFTADDIVEVEDRLNATLSRLRDLRAAMKKYNEKTVKISLSTAIRYSNWLKRWSKNEASDAESYLEASQEMRDAIDAAREAMRKSRETKGAAEKKPRGGKNSQRK